MDILHSDFGSLAKAKEEIQDVAESRLEVKREPQFIIEEIFLQSKDDVLVKKEMQDLEEGSLDIVKEEIFKAEVYDSVISDIENPPFSERIMSDGELASSATTSLRKKREETISLDVYGGDSIKDEYHERHLRHSNGTKALSRFNTAVESSDRPVVRPCSVILEDCLKQREFRIHSGERPFKCKECGKQFSQNSHLNLHLRTHSGELPFKCKECGKLFSHNSYLIQHLRTHSGERPFKCKECGKQFFQNSHLNLHLRTHSGERPFKCKECGYQFSRNSNLIRHLITHSGERPFKCKECGKQFYHNSILNRHLRTHSGERPFKCNECGKAFSRKSHLIYHLGIHS